MFSLVVLQDIKNVKIFAIRKINLQNKYFALHGAV
jgi:hypothetical protein